MTPALQKAADILPGILRNAIPKPHGAGFILEIEGAEMDALRELQAELPKYAHELTLHLKRITGLGDQIDQLVAHCPDAECSTCARIVCPHQDDMHFHHDGCPSCAE